ncbi:MAG: hypothetical protein GAK29_01436 [Acinetobacter bereziniae]|uniref:Uncharacterized protein n=1 Tax=Acinetobacter bereziniae TaxID=106648 RepID=A0A833PID5_ACIBZ|nr:MAG: hypothetical protein GAK29_01436 [Acinetobacter bereziniae]
MYLLKRNKQIKDTLSQVHFSNDNFSDLQDEFFEEMAVLGFVVNGGIKSVNLNKVIALAKDKAKIFNKVATVHTWGIRKNGRIDFDNKVESFEV